MSITPEAARDNALVEEAARLCNVLAPKNRNDPPSELYTKAWRRLQRRMHKAMRSPFEIQTEAEEVFEIQTAERVNALAAEALGLFRALKRCNAPRELLVRAAFRYHRRKCAAEELNGGPL